MKSINPRGSLYKYNDQEVITKGGSYFEEPPDRDRREVLLRVATRLELWVYNLASEEFGIRVIKRIRTNDGDKRP